MSQAKAQLFNRFSIPGKVFLLGEYAVLAGRPAVVAAVGPRFQMGVPSIRGVVPTWPEGSPVFRLIGWAKSQGVETEISFDFLDPYEGAGGFGASTAQFALVYQLLARSKASAGLSWKSVWQRYRDLMSSEKLIPSGADLVAQWEGGVVVFDPLQGTTENFGNTFDWSQLLVFSATHQAGRKVPTHEHLRQLGEGFPGSRLGLVRSLGDLLIRGIQALRENDPVTLGKVMSSYAVALWREGWEMQATSDDRLAFEAHPAVLGVKGTGALQSDALIVLTQKGADRSDLLGLAERRGLKLVCEGLAVQEGVRCDPSE